MRNWCLQTRSAQAKTTLMENSPHSAKIPCEGVLDRMPRKRSIVPETHRWNPFQGKPWRDSKAPKNQHILTLIEESTMEIKNGTWRKGTDHDFMKRRFRIGLGNHRKTSIYVSLTAPHVHTPLRCWFKGLKSLFNGGKTNTLASNNRFDSHSWIKSLQFRISCHQSVLLNALAAAFKLVNLLLYSNVCWRNQERRKHNHCTMNLSDFIFQFLVITILVNHI